MWFIELLDVILYPLKNENFYAVGDCLKTVIWWDDACHRIALNTFHLLKSTAREGESGKCDHHTNTISISNFEISCHRVGAVCLAALITNFKWSLKKYSPSNQSKQNCKRTDRVQCSEVNWNDASLIWLWTYTLTYLGTKIAPQRQKQSF